MLDRYDAFDVTSKPIRPKLCQFVVRNLDDVDRCDAVRVIHTKANLSQINSSKLRPVWSWSVCLYIVCILYFILNQWMYNKTIIDWWWRHNMMLQQYCHIWVKIEVARQDFQKIKVLKTGPVLSNAGFNNWNLCKPRMGWDQVIQTCLQKIICQKLLSHLRPC